MDAQTPTTWQPPVVLALFFVGFAFVLTTLRQPLISAETVWVYEGVSAGYCTAPNGGGACGSEFDIRLQPRHGGTLVIDTPVFRYFDVDAFIRDVKPGTPLRVEVLRCTGAGVQKDQYVVDVRTPTHVYLSRDIVRRDVGWWVEDDNGYTNRCLAAGRS